MPTLSGPVTGGRGWPRRPHHRTGRRRVPLRRVLPGGGGRPLRAGRRHRAREGGRWSVEPVARPYKTRLVVVRPVDPTAFDGTVIVLWNNVSAGYENFGGGDTPEVFERGSAYVAASVQRVGVHGQPDNPQGLRDWDPERYGTLSIPSDDTRSTSTRRSPTWWLPTERAVGSTPWTGWTYAGSSPRARRSQRPGWRRISTASSRSRDASTPSSS